MDEVILNVRKYLKGDLVIWSIVMLLSVFGILVVYSATGSLVYRLMDGNTEYYLIKHTLLVVVSFTAIWLIHKIDYQYFSKISKFIMWLSIPLLFITWMFGITMNEASRWIAIPFIDLPFQPSDVAKLALIISLANMLSKRQENIKDFQKAIIPMLFWIGLICGLIALSNISTSVLTFFICTFIMFVGRVPFRYLVMSVFIVVIFGSLAVFFGQRGPTAISRIENFVDKEIPYQVKHSYIAIASGGIMGKGPGQSDQRNYLPNPYSDFIYAIIVEEYGLVGGAMIVFLYILLLYRGIQISYHHESTYAKILVLGLTFAITFQALVNISVTIGLGPVTGLTLPFISMGGTSQLFAGIAVGIILSASKTKKAPTENTNKNTYIHRNAV